MASSSKFILLIMFAAMSGLSLAQVPRNRAIYKRHLDSVQLVQAYFIGEECEVSQTIKGYEVDLDVLWDRESAMEDTVATAATTSGFSADDGEFQVEFDGVYIVHLSARVKEDSDATLVLQVKENSRPLATIGSSLPKAMKDELGISGWTTVSTTVRASLAASETLQVVFTEGDGCVMGTDYRNFSFNVRLYARYT